MLSLTKLQILQAIADYGEEPFDTRELRFKLPLYSRQVINNHLREMMLAGIVIRLKPGKYQRANDTVVIDALEQEIEKNPYFRLMQSTFLLESKSVETMNKMVLIGEALAATSNPLARTYKQLVKEEAEDTRREVDQLLRNLQFRKIRRKEAVRRLRTANRNFLEDTARKHHPDTWTQYMALFDEAIKED